MKADHLRLSGSRLAATSRRVGPLVPLTPPHRIDESPDAPDDLHPTSSFLYDIPIQNKIKPLMRLDFIFA
jgi:hypothetical protein